MEPSEVIEHAQADAATEAAIIVAAEVAAAASAGDVIIATELAGVHEDLEVVAETIEEQHEEILEGQEWHALQWEVLSTRMTAMETILQSQTSMLAALQVSQLQALEILNRNLLQDSKPSIPPTLEPAPLEPAENPASEDGQEEVRTPEPAQPPKRKKFRLV